MVLDRKKLVRWLIANGFVEVTGASGHLQYAHPPSGAKVTVPGHGPVVMSRKHSSLIMRQLTQCGLSKKQVRVEMSDL